MRAFFLSSFRCGGSKAAKVCLSPVGVKWEFDGWMDGWTFGSGDILRNRCPYGFIFFLAQKKIALGARVSNFFLSLFLVSHQSFPPSIK